MKTENCFYVYVHYRLSDGKPFYVGKGKSYRHTSTVGRNSYWNRVVAKHGFKSVKWYSGLSEQEAFSLEVDTIKTFRAFGFKLANFTDGGEGCSGLKQSKETIEKRVKKNTGLKRTPEQCKKISVANTGKKHTEERRLKQSLALKGLTRDREAVEKTANSNRGQKRSPEQVETMRAAFILSAQVRGLSEKSKGNNNNASCKIIYTFENVDTGEIFTGTRCDLAEKLAIKPSRVCVLFAKNPRQSTLKRWRVKNDS